MDKKLIIFLIGFSLFYFLYYQFVLVPMEKKARNHQAETSLPAEAQKPAPPPQVPEEAKKPAPEVPEATPSVPESAIVEEPIQTPEEAVREYKIETPLYIALFSNKGAVLKSFRLKGYLDDFGNPLEMVPQDNPELMPLKLEFPDPEMTGVAESGVFSVTGEDAVLSGKEEARLEFDLQSKAYGVHKSYVFQADTYLIESVMEGKKDGTYLPVRVSWSPGLESPQSYKKQTFLKPSRGLLNNGSDVKHLDAKDVSGLEKVGSTVRWAGVENNYFLAIFIPPGGSEYPADAYMSAIEPENKKLLHNVNMEILGLKAEPLPVSIFVGPKDYLLLKELGMDLQEAVDFGFFGPISKVLFFVLRYLYSFTKNYGWAIVILTVLIKIIFTPFTQMSFASMKKMQLMQPELKQVQEKYKNMKNDDPRKQNMNVEIMGLHKRYGVNPLGGCLPMLVQMPVLFGFYRLLSNAIELRGAPFALWLQDLSRPDPYWVSPLLMGVTMLLQQRMTPSTDPMQQKMMYIMPIMFTYISINLPSGLVLYWLLSNMLAIGHQYYFKKQQHLVPATANGKS